MTDLYLDCSCHLNEHRIRFYREKYEGPHVLAGIEVHLNQHHSFFKRLLIAVKYIFGRKNDYGCFDDFLFNEEDLEKLEEWCKRTKSFAKACEKMRVLKEKQKREEHNDGS